MRGASLTAVQKGESPPASQRSRWDHRAQALNQGGRRTRSPARRFTSRVRSPDRIPPCTSPCLDRRSGQCVLRARAVQRELRGRTAQTGYEERAGSYPGGARLRVRRQVFSIVKDGLMAMAGSPSPRSRAVDDERGHSSHAGRRGFSGAALRKVSKATRTRVFKCSPLHPTKLALGLAAAADILVSQWADENRVLTTARAGRAANGARALPAASPWTFLP